MPPALGLPRPRTPLEELGPRSPSAGKHVATPAMGAVPIEALK